jgi:hypothetical protein
MNVIRRILASLSGTRTDASSRQPEKAVAIDPVLRARMRHERRHAKRPVEERLHDPLSGETASAAPASSPRKPHHEVFFRQLEETRKTDPLVGAKIGSKEVTQRVIDALQDERGVHFETALCIVASLAGYACQVSVRERGRRQFVTSTNSTGIAIEAEAASDKTLEPTLFIRVSGKDGNTYFFGDLLNEPLAKTRYSVLGLIGGTAQAVGCASVPSFEEAFKHCAAVVGSERFGWPRDFADRLTQPPIEHLRHAWAAFKPLLVDYCPEPEEWPILFGLSVQQIITQRPETVDPCNAMRFAMNIAIAMSKVDLAGAVQSASASAAGG